MTRCLITLLFAAMVGGCEAPHEVKRGHAPTRTAVADELCESGPDELVQAVLAQYGDDPERLQHAASRSIYSARFFLLDEADDAAAQAYLRQNFERGLSPGECHGFQPDSDNLKARAERILEEHRYRDAFELFGRAGDIAGQRRVIQRVEEAGEKEMLFAEGYSQSALGMYRRLNDEAGEQGFIERVFCRGVLERAESIIDKLGVPPTPSLYNARGDYWAAKIEAEGADAARFAAEAYMRSQNKTKLRELLDNPALARRASDAMLGVQLDIALYLEDRRRAADYATDWFIIDTAPLAEAEKHLALGGVDPTPVLYCQRGEMQLHGAQGHLEYLRAYEAFQKTGSMCADGIRRTLEAFTTPMERE